MATQALIVEDDPMVLKTLADLFRLHQYEVSTATSGADAIAMLAERDFDLVITDMRMETPLAGYDVVKTARAHSCKPVVAIFSGYPIPSPEWKQAGADAMFVKATGVRRMLTDLEEMLSRRRSERGKSATSIPTDEKQGKRVG